MTPCRDPRVGDRCECRLFAGKHKRADASGRLVERERWIYRSGTVVRVEATLTLVRIDGEPRARFVPRRAIEAVWKPAHTSSVATTGTGGE